MGFARSKWDRRLFRSNQGHRISKRHTAEAMPVTAGAAEVLATDRRASDNSPLLATPAKRGGCR